VAGCARCGQELAELRAVLTEVTRAGDVPEPSPLFWDHLSWRVREAIARERRPAAMRWFAIGTWRWTSLAALAAVVLAATLSPMLWHSSPGTTVPAVTTASVEPRTLDDLFTLADDPSLSLLGDLALDVDWSAGDADVVPMANVSETVVSGMSDAERAELGRLLREELGNRVGPGGV
jgi:hypothetical protein